MSEKAYVVAHIQVKDFDAYFEKYVGPLLPQFEEYGAKVLVASAEPDVREGELSGNWHVVLEFPNMASAHAWYGSPAYAPLKELRMSTLTDGGSLAILPSFTPPG